MLVSFDLLCTLYNTSAGLLSQF